MLLKLDEINLATTVQASGMGNLFCPSFLKVGYIWKTHSNTFKIFAFIYLFQYASVVSIESFVLNCKQYILNFQIPNTRVLCL